MPAATQTMDDRIAKIDSLVRKLGIPAHEIKVFGVLRVNIIVTCKSEKTAKRWHFALNRFAPGARMVETLIPVAARKNTLNSTVRGWQVGASF